MSLHINYIFNRTKPIIIGVECIDKYIKLGMKIAQNNIYIGKIDAIQVNTQNVTTINPGDKAIIKIESENLISTNKNLIVYD